MRKLGILAVACAVVLVVVTLFISRRSGISVAESAGTAPPKEVLPKVADVRGGTPGGEFAPAAELTDEGKKMLRQNGFVVVAQKYPFDDVAGLYRNIQRSRVPVFVTTDSVLHTSHLVFDWYQRFLETAHLRSDLLNLADSGIAMSMAYWDQSRSRSVKDAAVRNAAYFYVAKAILGEKKLSEVPADLREKIEGELKLIDGYQGLAQSPLLGYKEDYSQYVPRGHYSRSPELRSYFKAMMWFGRMSFHLNGSNGRDETRQALLLCKALSEGKVKGERSIDVWRRIEEITSFFAGKSDDLTPAQYIPLAEKVLGTGLPLEELANDSRLDRFRAEAAKMPRPQVLSTLFASTQPDDWQSEEQSFRLLGQRLAADSVVFQQLVYDRVGRWLGEGPKPFTWTDAQGLQVRGFARGLDVLAALGSDEAKDIVEKDGDASFERYGARLAALRKKLAAMPEPADLYAARLALLKEVASQPQTGVPSFMRKDAWRRKALAAALGTWTELRHDTILYTKQSYTMAQAAFATMGKGGPQEVPKPVHGYVEPCPKVYAAVGKTVKQLRTKIETLGFPPDPALSANLTHLETLMASLETISKKELTGQRLTDAEQDLIEHYGIRLGGAASFTHYWDVTDNFQSVMDRLMPIVADVHTDVNSGMALEEAVGHPMEIYVTATVDGKPTLCKGVVYSCYEFKQPASHRLTDEAWRKTLEEKRNPGLPAWMAAYVPRATVPRTPQQQGE